jgi:serine/threonine protein kinase
MVTNVNPLNLQPGEMVDGWRIIRPLGRGSYAVVYEVEKDGQRFALKLACHTGVGVDPKRTDERAEREVACLQQLKHPHIVRMWSHGRWPDPKQGFVYIVLSFIKGCTLARWVELTHPTPHEIVVLFLKLFDAVDYIHRHHMAHRDLSLNNILITEEGEPVIIDFGVADYATAEELTEAPLPPGTRRNRSPEAQRFWEENRDNPQARYAYQEKDDIFALGANLYDVLTDPTPTRAKQRPPLGNEVMPPPCPHRATQGRVPPELSSYVLTLIHPDLAVRPERARNVRRALEEFARQEGEAWHGHSVHLIEAQLPPPPPEGAPARVLQAGGLPVPPAEKAASRPRFGWRQPALLALLVPVVLAAAVAALLPHTPPPSPASSPLAEKPTSRPAPLASLLPTQQEAIPSVKQPDNSPTLTHGTPTPEQLPQASKQRGFSKEKRCAALVFSFGWAAAGCAGVQKRPEPFVACPEESIKAMRQELGWEVESNAAPFIYIDERNSDEGQPGKQDDYAVFKDGPVVGVLIDPEGKAPPGTRLEGHLWTTGDRIYGRYIRAHLPGGRTVPICTELEKDEDNVGVPKKAGSKPGEAVAYIYAQTRNVKRWR